MRNKIKILIFILQRKQRNMLVQLPEIEEIIQNQIISFAYIIIFPPAS